MCCGLSAPRAQERDQQRVLSRASRAAQGCAMAELLVVDEALELLQAATDVASHGRRCDPLREPSAEAGSRDSIGQAKLDPSPAVGGFAEPPAPALVEAGDRGPGHLAWFRELDELDQAADLGGA